jgi:hypothetical protein
MKWLDSYGFAAGLPDGLFSYQKLRFGYILEGFGMENVGIYYHHLVHFMTIWYSLWSHGIFIPFGYI